MSGDPDNGFKYWAFVSYSSKDRGAGEWLIRELEIYRVPASLVGLKTACGTIPARLYPVFRDRDELRASADLGAALVEALRRSRCLIVLCSPNSADPESWVNTEISSFKAIGRQRDVLALILDGEPGASEHPGSEGRECFPAALRYRVDAEGMPTDERAEPLAADLTREDRNPRVSRRKAFLKLVAGIIDVDFDVLEQRDRRRRRQRAAIWSVAVVALLAAFAGQALLWYGSDREAISQQLAGEARQKLASEIDLGALLALHAYNTDPTPAAYGALLAVPERNQHLMAFLHRGSAVSALALSPDNRMAAVADCATTDCDMGQLHLYDLATLRPTGRIQIEAGEVTDMEFHPGGRQLFLVTGNTSANQLLALNLSQLEIPPTRLFFERLPITDLAISGDGSLYSVAMEGGEFKVFGDKGRQCGGFLRTSIVTSAFSRDGRFFAVGADDQDVVLVEIESCERYRLFLRGQIGDLAFDPDGARLSAILLDGTITEWDTETRARVDTYTTTNASPNRFFHVFSNDSAALASVNNAELWLYDLARRRSLRDSLRSGDVSEIWHERIREEIDNPEIARLRGHPGTPRLIRFSPDNGRIISADETGTVLLWDVAGAPLVAPDPSDATIVPPERPMTEATRGDGRLRAWVTEETEGCSGDATGDCQRWTRLTLTDTGSGLDIAILEYHDRGIIDLGEPWVEFTADGKAVVGRENSRTVWHIDPPHLIARACRIANRPLSAAERDQYLGWRKHLPWASHTEVCSAGGVRRAATALRD